MAPGPFSITRTCYPRQRPCGCPSPSHPCPNPKLPPARAPLPPASPSPYDLAILANSPLPQLCSLPVSLAMLSLFSIPCLLPSLADSPRHVKSVGHAQSTSFSLCSGLLQVPLAVLALMSTIRILLSVHLLGVSFAGKLFSSPSRRFC